MKLTQPKLTPQGKESSSSTTSNNSSVDSSTPYHQKSTYSCSQVKSSQKDTNKIEGKESTYRDKRSYIFNWLRKHSSKLKLSRQAAAMTQIMADHYYSLRPYRSSQTRLTLITIITLCSKYCDYKIVFPEQMAYIFDTDLKTIYQQEERIVQALGFNLCFHNYALQLNNHLYQWDKVNKFSFFKNDLNSFLMFCKVHALVEKIYQRNSSVSLKDLKFCIHSVLNEGVNKRSTEISEKQNYQGDILADTESKWHNNRKLLESIFKERKMSEKYSEFMIRYAFIE